MGEHKNPDDYKTAAATNPENRTPHQEALVQDGLKRGMSIVTEGVHATEKRIRRYGH